MASITNYESFSSGLYFEVKKTIVGFRVTVTIEADFGKKSYCIFVDVQKTPTVGHLYKDMLGRFNLNGYGNPRFFVGESEVLAQECILVLADVRKFRVRMNRVLVSSTLVPDPGDSSSSSSSNGNHDNPDTEDNPGNASTTSLYQHENRASRDELKGSKSKTRDSKSKKENIYSQSGVARLLKHLKEESVVNVVCNEKSDTMQSLTEFHEQLNKENETENSISPHNTHQISEKECKTSSDRCKSGILSGETYSNSDHVGAENQNSDELNELFLEKGKRKRKRKHSKKKDQNMKTAMNTSDVPVVSHSSSAQNGSGKHIFFNDFEEVDDVDNVDGTNDEVRSKILRYVDEKIPGGRTNSSFYRCTSNESSKMDCDYVAEFSNIENLTTTFVEQDQIQENAVESSHSAKKYPSFVPTSRQSAETSDKLGTLLMLKDLKMCSQYKVQFSDQDKTSTFRHNPCDSETRTSISSLNSISPSKGERARIIEITPPSKKCVRTTKKTSSTSEITNTVPKKNECENENQTSTKQFSSKECEMVLQFKVVNDKIFLRNSDTEWKELTVELAVEELIPVKKPVRGQTIVFQLLYLKNNLYPTISRLILGHILNYDPVLRKIVVEIQSSLLEDIMCDCEGDDANLPEGMTSISDQVYELDWIAVKNPREIQ